MDDLQSVISQVKQSENPTYQEVKDDNLGILTEEQISQIVNEKVQKAIKIEQEKLERQKIDEIAYLEAKTREKIALRKEYKKMIAKKLNTLEEKLSKKLITHSQYELESKEIRSHIDFLEKM